MKRIPIRPGKYVTVSSAMAEKAAKAFQLVAYSREQLAEMISAEPSKVGPMAGEHRRAPLVRRRGKLDNVSR